jgi:hypothetical protein
MTGSASGTIVTDPTGGAATVTWVDPVFPSTEALMSANPAATPVTVPALDTLATVAFEVAHESVFPVIGAPAASRTVAVRVSVPPTSSGPAGAPISTVDTTGTTCCGAGGSVEPPHPRRARTANDRVRECERGIARIQVEQLLTYEKEPAPPPASFLAGA